jgi:archaetidylinositol phosphate synthase
VKDPAELKKMGGLLERGERLLLLYAGMAAGLFRPEWMIVAVALAAVLANITVLQRIAFTVRK